MSQNGTTCPACGAENINMPWCQQCGYTFDSQQTQQGNWLETGSHVCAHVNTATLGFTESAQLIEVDFEIVELLSDYHDRRVFTAKATAIMVIDQDTQVFENIERAIQQQLYIVEESTVGVDIDAQTLPDILQKIVRTPIVRGQHGDHILTVFADNTGVALDELIDLAHGHLSLAQIKEIALSLFDLVETLHDAGYLHLSLAPWNIRVLDDERPDGYPQRLLNLNDTLEGLDGGCSDNSADTRSFNDVIADEINDSFDGDNDEKYFLGQVSESDFEDRDKTKVDIPVKSLHLDQLDRNLESNLTSVRAVFDHIAHVYAVNESSYADLSHIPGYSAPEIMGHVDGPIQETADVFSLGMILYYLLTARTPPVSSYSGYTPVVTPRHFREDFPYGLQSVISRAVRPDPAERYPSLFTLREAFLDACELVERRRQTTPYNAPAILVAAERHVGIGKRLRNPSNQDHVFAQSADNGQLAVMAVADGVSTASYGTGEIASNMMIEEIAKLWNELHDRYMHGETFDVEQVILNVFASANRRIVDYVNEHHHPFNGNPHEVMGSTVVLAIYYQGVITLASLGDSRAYLQTLAGIEQLTTDHNLWTLSLLDGIDADSALSMAHGEALAQCLGSFSVTHQNSLEPIDPIPDMARIQITRNDTLLLTTDGLIDYSGETMIDAEDNVLAVLVSEPDPALACLELVVLANRGGGGDNIGVVVARFN